MKDAKLIPVCAVATYLPVKAIKFHPDNPRTITRQRLDDLKLSIVSKGFYEPLLVWKKGHVVLAGNHRTRACLELIDEGYTFVAPNGEKDALPVVIEDVTPEVAEEILFESNNHYAEWVEDKLAEALAEAKSEGRNLMAFGFTTKQVDDLLEEALKGIKDEETTEVAGHTRKLGGIGDNEIPEASKIRVKLGDTWKLGEHLLRCGDGAEVLDVEALMKDERATLAFTIPPDDQEACGAEFISALQQKKLASLIVAVMRPTVHEGLINFGEAPYINTAARSGLKLLAQNVWNHGVLKKSAAMFPVAHTWLLVFGEAKRKLTAHVVDVESGEDTRVLATVLDLPKEPNTDCPLGLPEAYIQACTAEGDIVIDPFAGEGSTLIACHKHHRKARVLVLDPKAAQVVIDRWELYSGHKAANVTPAVLKAKRKKAVGE